MKNIFLIIFLLITKLSSGQTNQAVSVIDFVKIKNNYRKEALFYYENNWKASRDIAVRKGYIQSYSLLSTTPDSSADFDLMLITVYKDSAQLSLVEERFQEIFKEMRSGGPVLLNDIKPGDFRQNVFSKKAETIFSSDQKK